MFDSIDEYIAKRHKKKNKKKLNKMRREAKKPCAMHTTNRCARFLHKNIKENQCEAMRRSNDYYE